MKIGKYGLALIKKAEGFRPKIYDDVGHPAIGYGLRLSQKEVAEYQDGITEEQATELLREFLESVEYTVSKLLTAQLNQNQFDALMSLVYNIGVGNFMSSTILKMLNTKNFDAVPAEFMKWTKSGGKELKGLVERRKVEVALWNDDLKNEVLRSL